MLSHFLNKINYVVPEANPIITSFNLQDMSKIKSLYTLDENIKPHIT